ncbi:MAG: L,D-transpeptidase [Phyllobacterium sp.]
MSRGIVLVIAMLFPVLALAGVPFWGAPGSDPVETPSAQLMPGHWIWSGDTAPAGPMALVVSLTEQRAYAYRNGLLVGVSTISSGRKGHETPTGVFTILQKDKDHHSSIYNNAAMPFTQRLTWGGIALHAGGLPGYPSSHGCVHLPSGFAAKLYDASPAGMTVVVADEGKSPREVAHPTEFTPIDSKSGAMDVQPGLSGQQAYRWQPQLSPDGPLSVLLSGSDKSVIVFRNGVEIGRAQIAIRDPDKPLGTHVYVIKSAATTATDPLEPGMPRWTAIGVPGHAAESGIALDPAAVHRIMLPDLFARDVYPLLQPGTTLMVTDAAVLPANTALRQHVLDSNPPES